MPRSREFRKKSKKRERKLRERGSSRKKNLSVRIL